MKIWQLITIAACLACLVGTAILYGAANEENTNTAALEQQLQEALKTRAASAQRALEAMTAAFEAETVTFDTFADAMKKLAEAEVALATTLEEKVAALQRNVERTKQAETKIKLLYNVGTRGGEAKEYFSAKRDRESAEIMLLKARIRQSK